MTRWRSVVMVVVGALLLESGVHAVSVEGALGEDASYREGTLSGQADGDMFHTVQATKGAAGRLRLTSVKETGDEFEARLVAFDPHGTKIVIRLAPDAVGRTGIRIRVGLFGDERYSRRILKEIQVRLP